MAQIIQNLGGLVGATGEALISQESLYYFKSYFVVLIVAIIGATPILKNLVSREKVHKIMNVLEPVYLLLIFVISTSYIIDGSFNPFLYFRF